MGEKVYTLRIDEEVFNQVKKEAERNRRSVAKQVEHILASYFVAPLADNPNVSSPEANALIKKMIELAGEYGAIIKQNPLPDDIR